MSNHSGSYMLNEVLRYLDQQGVFELAGEAKTQEIVLKIVKISDQYDCNPGEILDGLQERFGICAYCMKPAERFEDGYCPTCPRPEGR